MAGERLVKLMQHAGKTPASATTDLLFGSVTSTVPLKIKIDNKFEITSEFLVLSALVKEKKITVSLSEGSTTITLWRGLIVGDKVRLLRVNNGQTFYVLERDIL